MNLFEWGEKRFARGIARAMIRSYKLIKSNQPTLSERELIKATLSTRAGEPAQELLNDMNDLNFWEGVVGKSFVEVCFLLIRMEYVVRWSGLYRQSLGINLHRTRAVFC